MKFRKLLHLWSGFAQPDEFSNGCRDLVRDISRSLQVDEWAGYAKWKDDFKTPLETAQAIALWIHRNCLPDAIIQLGGHSYGGHTSLMVCDFLDRVGRVVNCLYLADAVEQTGIWGLLKPKTLFIPGNVQHCLAWRQEGIKPRGSVLVRKAQDTLLEVKVIKTPHFKMDEHDEFQATVTNGFLAV